MSRVPIPWAVRLRASTPPRPHPWAGAGPRRTGDRTRGSRSTGPRDPPFPPDGGALVYIYQQSLIFYQIPGRTGCPQPLDLLCGAPVSVRTSGRTQAGQGQDIGVRSVRYRCDARHIVCVPGSRLWHGQLRPPVRWRGSVAAPAAPVTGVTWVTWGVLSPHSRLSINPVIGATGSGTGAALGPRRSGNRSALRGRYWRLNGPVPDSCNAWLGEHFKL